MGSTKGSGATVKVGYDKITVPVIRGVGICGDKFNVNKDRRKLCSDQCKLMAIGCYQQDWKTTNNEKVKKYMRSYRRKHLNDLKQRSLKYYYENHEIKRIQNRENTALHRNFGTAIIDAKTKEMFAITQLVKRFIFKKVTRSQMIERIHLIQQGETYHGYK